MLAVAFVGWLPVVVERLNASRYNCRRALMFMYRGALNNVAPGP